MSDAHRWSVRAPRAQPNEGAPRAPGGGTDLRPRFADLLRQRQVGAEDGMPRPFGDDPLGPVDPLGPPLQEGADDEPADDEATGRDGPAAALPPEPVVMPAPPDMTLPEAAAGGAARAAQAHTVQLQAPPQVSRLADTVANFCNDRAVTNGDSWQVQIELRPDLLPATTLLLSLSPHWLCLRFDIRDDGARHLVFTHRQALAEQLEDTLVRRREISITFD